MLAYKRTRGSDGMYPIKTTNSVRNANVRMCYDLDQRCILSANSSLTINIPQKNAGKYLTAVSYAPMFDAANKISQYMPRREHHQSQLQPYLNLIREQKSVDFVPQQHFPIAILFFGFIQFGV